MDIKESFNTIVGIEAAFDTAQLETVLPNVGPINLWPITRYCLWSELLRRTSPENSSPVTYQGIVKQISAKCHTLARAVTACPHMRTSIPSNSCTLFVSRPVYLQHTKDGHLADRVVDPLIMLLAPSARPSKLYLTSWIDSAPLAVPAKWLLPKRRSASLPTALTEHVYSIADLAGVPRDRFLRMNEAALASFFGWYARGKEMFRKCTRLKHIYLTSWYFPDMMGLTAAARQSGITVTEVQHGKQGLYQPMYSGWTSIPEGPLGYLMMPDRFWCWGEPSRKHILAAQPDRQTHIPFVGGYPWIDYFRQNFGNDAMAGTSRKDGTRIIFSMQPEFSLNPVPVPDAFFELLKDGPSKFHITFKIHPNDSKGQSYLQTRLTDVPADRYKILAGRANLYELFENATHHVTAFSSCCYEATAFDLPTLLFGQTSARVYKQEIAEGQFSWTTGHRAEIEKWLRTTSPETFSEAQDFTPYILSSMEMAKRLMDESDH